MAGFNYGVSEDENLLLTREQEYRNLIANYIVTYGKVCEDLNNFQTRKRLYENGEFSFLLKLTGKEGPADNEDSEQVLQIYKGIVVEAAERARKVIEDLEKTIKESDSDLHCLLKQTFEQHKLSIEDYKPTELPRNRKESMK